MAQNSHHVNGNAIRIISWWEHASSQEQAPIERESQPSSRPTLRDHHALLRNGFLDRLGGERETWSRGSGS